MSEIIGIVLFYSVGAGVIGVIVYKVGTKMFGVNPFAGVRRWLQEKMTNFTGG